MDKEAPALKCSTGSLRLKEEPYESTAQKWIQSKKEQIMWTMQRMSQGLDLDKCQHLK